ncbi:conjugal transfer protein TraD [Phenylobacterium soli]|uniref:conjugal transfer protein TraD n=1 Tax=Phenylobacterium soli TaxID=2170551 RepID=UPI001D039DBF|nr:conjugal transfer protein TraD [Phenylobacterium soli]
MERRERTHRLIELGGLVQKSGLAERVGDDRATLYGALLSLVDRLSSDERETTLALWRRRGRRAFDQEQAQKAAVQGPPSAAP